MMTNIGLRSKILLSFVGLIFLSSLTTILAVILATNSSVEAQAKDKLIVGQNVFEQLLDIRSEQLFESAQVLTADFGFKTAVLTGDESTIVSVLANHGARIGADLMMLTSLDGQLIASTGSIVKLTHFPFQSLLSAAAEQGGLASTVVLQNKPYQILMLPVNAPITKAWALAGFEMDLSLASQLKELTSLEVGFIGSGEDGSGFELTTLALEDLGQYPSSDLANDWKLFQKDDERFLALVTTLVDESEYRVVAQLSTSLEQALESFEPLKIQILSIAILALVMSSIAGFVMSKNITRPVNNLVKAAERIADGDYQVEITDQRFKQNELATLANSLDNMQRGIATREAQILYQAHNDQLTGLENRSAITKRMTALIQDSPRRSGNIGLMLIDIRHFKQINDTLGYQVGDALLVAIAQRLKAHKTGDIVPSRIAVDEFLVIVQGASGKEVEQQCQSLLGELSELFQIDELTIKADFYYGLAIYPEHGSDTEQLLRRADIALNKGKDSRSRSQVYEVGLDEKHLKHLQLINNLKEAITSNQLSVHYQPKVDLKQRKVTQVEALVRWIHPEFGFISPGEFIPLAEQSGLMPLLTRWVIRETVMQGAQWKEQGVHLQIAVNLSAHDLSNDDLPDYIASMLKKQSMPADAFIFEVTESAMMEDPEQALSVLNRLKALGFLLAVDDYGTGYSSLSQLKGMPVDELKIDMSFVLNLDQSAFDQAVVQSTIEMGHKLGLTIVAEGVETAEAWQILEKWHCDKLQGYFIAKPQPAAEFIAWLDAYSLPDCRADAET
ncbi:hypothetical protein A3750_04470 [Oleiphilus sp. HI0079]|uniref:EAL domain-containing protein n=3 Tax=unclassified Oleiphilus TaxID=2631174 RepID=UPI0007C3ECB4|nr:EAL domain-containing protein [Oleiphilus sp. HI0079]KZZ13006.1 hypothetical protein A3750_04470 [Oleiphilus sp. HI0079]KZZ80254.1 hypothetical protein A3767_00790 [Oleiphilus sp. HI0133]